jgi:internalin A
LKSIAAYFSQGLTLKLSSLTKLKRLEASNVVGPTSEIPLDLSPLSGLKELDYLQLPNNSITDPSPLYGLSNLKSLYLGGNQISLDKVNELKNALPDCLISFDLPSH